MRLGTAIECLVDNYKYASDKEWINDKVAWALYHTWKEADRKTENSSEKPNNCTEPTWEQVKEYCNKRCLDIVDSAMRKKWYKDEPQTDKHKCRRCVYYDVSSDYYPCVSCVDYSNYTGEIEDEPQTDNGIGCSKCESRYECYDRDMPHAVHCNNYGKITDEPQTDCAWKKGE